MAAMNILDDEFICGGDNIESSGSPRVEKFYGVEGIIEAATEGGDEATEGGDEATEGGDESAEGGDEATEGGARENRAWYKVGAELPIVSIAGGLLPTIVNECSLISPGSGSSNNACSTNRTISKIAEVVGERVSPDQLTPIVRKNIIEKAKKKTGCSDEKCIISSNEIVSAIGKEEATKELNTNFKKKGPTDTGLLNNFNIDETLKQWQIKFPDFFAYNFNMRDFEHHKDTLSTVTMEYLHNNGFKTAGCVINSDYYSGRGKHWMALFVDMRANNPGEKWTVEFFNSSGNPPYAEFAGWMLKTKSQLETILSSGKLNHLNITVETVNCCDIPHQKTKTECGLYSLYYIWARINNTPINFFQQNIISDVLMINFRQHLFTGSSNKSGEKSALGVVNGKFDIKSYNAKVLWEDDVDGSTIEKAKSGKGGGAENPASDITAEDYEIMQEIGSADNVRGGADNVRGGAEHNTAELTPLQKKLGYTGCQIGESIEEVTRKLVEEGAISPDCIYGNLISEAEVKLKKDTNSGVSFPGKPGTPESTFSLILNHGQEHRMPYRKGNVEQKTSLHWGQRKLLLSEIEAIIECRDILMAKKDSNGDENAITGIVLYAGSAPGNHIPYLSKLFPTIKFILYDPRDFSIAATPRIELHNGFFTNETAQKYSRKSQYRDENNLPILFISDIRNGSPLRTNSEEFEKEVAADMQSQWDWQNIGEFDAAFYKFRLPYCEPGAGSYEVEYLDGTIYYGVFMPKTSTESRLLVRGSDGGKTRKYDALVYEQEHFYHNMIRRIWGYFDHNVIGEGIDHCYDCRAEIEILSIYIKYNMSKSEKIGEPVLSDEELNRKIAVMSKEITNALTHFAKENSSRKLLIKSLVHPPHGVCKNVPMEEKFGYNISKYKDILTRDAEIKKKRKH